MNLGTDSFEMATVYSSKFKSSKSPRANNLERIEIKNRMEIDTVALGQHGVKIDG